MESMGIVQARTPESVKENATNILEKLGLNMSTYINMALNQLIIQEGIPFAVKLAKSSYTDEEKIRKVSRNLKDGRSKAEVTVILVCCRRLKVVT